MSTASALPLSTQALLQAGLDHIHQGITIFDGELKMVGWNQRFLELLDFPESLAFEGATFESFMRFNAERGEYGPGDIETQVRTRVAEAARFLPHELERVRPDGLVLQVKGSPLPGGGFVAVYTDVTEQRSRERMLEKRISEHTEALRQSEARLRLIANEVPAGIAHCDQDLRFQFVNRRFANAYGFSQFEMIGRPADDILSEETMRVSRPFFEHARRGAAVDFDMTLKLPNGQPIDIRTFLRPEGPSDGEVVGFYLLSINVTRQKQATAALLQAQKMDALGQLSSGIAHDFNNLLTVILGNLTPLKERISDGALVQDMLEPAIRAARRGADLTRRLLTVARRNPLEPVAVDVEEAIAGLVKLLRPSMPETIEIVTSSRGRGHVAFVDPAQLETALLNLAVNARDALVGGGQIRIATSMRSLVAEEAEDWKLPPGDYVQIVFEDDGPGMPADTLGRIFEPFFTTKPTGKGSGLGLSMVYGFIRQSNGMIRATSQPGKGARFTLLLPQAEHADLPVETPVPEVVPTERQGLALLVDDDEGVRSVLRRQLVDLGYPLIEASDAAEALDVIRSVDGVSVMVTDIAMPGSMNGLDLAREVRGLKPEIGIVLMTGHGGALERAASGGEFPLLRKPFERGALTQALDQVAARAAALSPVTTRVGAIA